MSGITQRMSHEIFISCKLPGTGISHSTPRNVIDLQNIITWGASTFPRLDSFSFFLFFFTRQAEHSCLNGTKLSFARCRLYFLLFCFGVFLLHRWDTRAPSTWNSARRWARSAPGNSPRSVVAPRKRHNRRPTAGVTASSRRDRAMTVTTSPRTPSTRRRYTCCGHTAVPLARANNVNFDPLIR